MTSRTGPGAPGPAMSLVPTALALVAEAAWISVVEGMLQAFSLRDPLAGIPVLLLAAVAGLVTARTLAPRLGERWPEVLVGLAALVGAAGWLAAPEVRSIIGAQGVDGAGEALLANPGGWLTALAFVRGVAHAQMPPDPGSVALVLGLGVPGLAFATLAGGMVADPWRSRFLLATEAEVVVFLIAGVLALALARLARVGHGAALDWRRNPGWVALLVTLVAGTAVVAVAASPVAGPAIVAVVGASLVPLLLLGLIVGFDRRSVRILVVAILIAAVIGPIVAAVSNRLSTIPTAPGGGIVEPSEPATTPQIAIGVLLAAVFILVLLVLALARIWMRRPRFAEDDVDETRSIDHGVADQPPPRRGRRGRFRRWFAPPDAVSAYRALIEDLAPHPGVRRESGETPAEHARRLRRTEIGALSLELLAADYGLVRFGGRRLSAAEERRAVRRAADLRRRLPALVRAASPVSAEAVAGGRRSVAAASGVGPEPTDETIRPGAGSIGRQG